MKVPEKNKEKTREKGKKERERKKREETSRPRLHSRGGKGMLG